MSNPVQIPKFQFNNNSVKTDKELEEKLAKTGGNKYLNPGKHEVVIKSVEYVGAAKDSRWGKFKVLYEGTDAKTTNEILLVPFSEIQYKGESGKETLFPYTRVQKFMKALGVDLKVQNLQDILTEYFSKPEKSLVGQVMAITVGYEGNYVEWRGKDTTGNSQYALVGKDGASFGGVFSSRDAALAHAEQNQISVEEYTRILSYAPSATPAKKVAGNW